MATSTSEAVGTVVLIIALIAIMLGLNGVVGILAWNYLSHNVSIPHIPLTIGNVILVGILISLVKGD